MTQEPTLHFIVKENGKLYYLPEVPEEPKQYEQGDEMAHVVASWMLYRERLLRAKDNAIEVENQDDIYFPIWDKHSSGHGWEFKKDTIYSLTGNYLVEIFSRCITGGCRERIDKEFPCADLCTYKRIALISLKPEVKKPETIPDLQEMINKVHESMEGRYDLTGDDLHTIQSMLCLLQEPEEQKEEETQDELWVELGNFVNRNIDLKHRDGFHRMTCYLNKYYTITRKQSLGEVNK